MMWVTKISIPSNEGMLMASKAKKNKVFLMGYPLSYFKKDGKFFIFASAYILGNNKDAFLKDMKKDKRSIKLDMMNDNFGFWLMEQHLSVEPFYDPMIIYIKPMIIDEQGESILELASWDKEKLMTIAKLVQTKLYGGKLISFTKQKINNITITSAFPELTDKQKTAFELAVKNGYYGYPRKIDMKQLAKLMKISLSTFEFHLRNAEKKLMPHISSQLN